jgi:hypothetical protein
MPSRRFYLAKYRRSSNQRWHFSIFIPNANYNHVDLSRNPNEVQCKGTIIHVVGEPVGGYSLQFKRNYECKDSQQLQEMVLLGQVDDSIVFNPTDTRFLTEVSTRARIDKEAAAVLPPSGHQDVRAPVDGVSIRDELMKSSITNKKLGYEEGLPRLGHGVSRETCPVWSHSPKCG